MDQQTVAFTPDGWNTCGKCTWSTNVTGYPRGLERMVTSFLQAGKTLTMPWHMSIDVMVERHVKLFKNGRNQAVRIPREFELPGEDAIIRKEGQRLIIEPVPPRSLLAVLAALPTLDEEFPPIKDLPAEPVDF